MAKNKTASYVAQVIANGRTTIPIPLRKSLGIKEGDFVELTVKLCAAGGN